MWSEVGRHCSSRYFYSNGWDNSRIGEYSTEVRYKSFWWQVILLGLFHKLSPWVQSMFYIRSRCNITVCMMNIKTAVYINTNITKHLCDNTNITKDTYDCMNNIYLHYKIYMCANINIAIYIYIYIYMCVCVCVININIEKPMCEINIKMSTYYVWLHQIF